MPTLNDARKWYKNSDPVHGFSHIERIHRVALQLSIRENADQEIVSAAALLHDVQQSEMADNEVHRKQHHLFSADFASRILSSEGWPEEKIAAVRHCILSHRFRDPSEEPTTLEAKVLFDADKLDAIGAIGVIRAVAYAVQANQTLLEMPSRKFMTSGKKNADEPHTPLHEYLYKLQYLKDRLYTASAREIAIGRHQQMAAFFEQLIDELNYE